MAERDLAAAFFRVSRARDLEAWTAPFREREKRSPSAFDFSRMSRIAMPSKSQRLRREQPCSGLEACRRAGAGFRRPAGSRPEFERRRAWPIQPLSGCCSASWWRRAHKERRERQAGR